MLGAAALVLLAASAGREAESAASDGQGMAAMLIDMDPSGAPANAASSLGSIETCARIERNGRLDADEDAVADTLTADVTAHDIPAATAMIGFNYSLRYDESALTLQGADHNYLLKSSAGSSLFNASQGTPDTDGSNSWDASVLDIEPAASESGSGVLTRMTISADAGAAPGAYKLSLGITVHLDAVSAYFPANLNWDSGDDEPALDGVANVAEIAVDQPCGGPLPPGGTTTVAPTHAPPATPGAGTPAGATGGPTSVGTPSGTADGSPMSATPGAGSGSPSGTAAANGGGGGDGSSAVAVVALVAAGGALAAAGGGWFLYRRRKLNADASPKPGGDELRPE